MKQYDRTYFDRWYRDARRRIITPAPLTRRVAWVIATAEYVLQRPIKNVLDVGCGEGHWARAIRRLRPQVTYTGVDPSAYVVKRYGVRRHILHGTIEHLDALPLDTTFDVVICCAMLNYLAPRAVDQGLAQIGARLGGVAHIEIFTRGDPVEGDFREWRWHTAPWVRQRIRRARLIPIGLQCYVKQDRMAELNALEIGR